MWSLGILLGLLILVYLFAWYGYRHEAPQAAFGVTFSTVMAKQLGFAPSEVYDAIINDLGVRYVRIPVYWADVEKERGHMDFAEYDYFVRRAEENGVRLILAVGRKLPRWPECFIPAWAKNLPESEIEDGLLNQIRETVTRYKDSPAVTGWQVENETYFKFGANCGAEKVSEEYVRREIALVRSLDARPIAVTDSGEQGRWLWAASGADVLGITMYNHAWNPTLGLVRFHFGPGFYRLKYWLLQLLLGPKLVQVYELQAEPWGPTLLPGYSVALQKELMSIEELRKAIKYARQTGFDTFYLWGAEWWYWMGKTQNDWNYWNEMKELMKQGV